MIVFGVDARSLVPREFAAIFWEVRTYRCFERQASRLQSDGWRDTDFLGGRGVAARMVTMTMIMCMLYDKDQTKIIHTRTTYTALTVKKYSADYVQAKSDSSNNKHQFRLVDL
jgi:hypothetical protein